MLKNYYHAKHIRRGLTLLLCLIFVLGAMPAFASEGETAAEGAAAAEADRLIRIPMCGNVESLNAGVASAILMYEAGRQRRREKT